MIVTVFLIYSSFLHWIFVVMQDCMFAKIFLSIFPLSLWLCNQWWGDETVVLSVFDNVESVMLFSSCSSSVRTKIENKILQINSNSSYFLLGFSEKSSIILTVVSLPRDIMIINRLLSFINITKLIEWYVVIKVLIVKRNVTKKDKYLFENGIIPPLQKRFSHIFKEQ